MTFNLQVPRGEREQLDISVSPGDVLFVLGANGTGKSSLMHRFFVSHRKIARRLLAHRQTWFQSAAITLSPHEREQAEQYVLSRDAHPESRWIDDYGSARTNMAIFDLIDAEHVRARSITKAVDSGDFDLTKKLSADPAPITVINELLRLSNLPVVLSIHEFQKVMASKGGSELYSAAELSDGERNAILVAATVLTVKQGTLILIDEPDRHLHRSVISPLLTLLFAERPDCAFVISTHDVMLPVDNPGCRTLLLSGNTWKKGAITAWDADLLPPDAEIDEQLKADILGARRRMILVEGIESSLDKPLYSLVFPDVSIIPKATSREVEHSVRAIRDAGSLHWIHAFGIVDNDGRSQDELERLKERGVYALAAYSVESIYYHPDLQRAVTQRHAEVTGEDASARVAKAKDAAIEAIGQHVQRLSERAAERQLRDQVFKNLPGKSEIANGAPIEISLDVPVVVAAERARLESAIDSDDLDFLIAHYPVRDTPALDTLAKKLGFQDRAQYESAVRRLLMDNEDMLKWVRSLFGTLPADIGVDQRARHEAVAPAATSTAEVAG